MKAQALAYFPTTSLTCAALLLFFGVFVLKAMRVFGKENRKNFERMAALPLSEDGDSK